MKLKYCEKCEDWVEPEEGACPDCLSPLVKRKEKLFDEFDDGLSGSESESSLEAVSEDYGDYPEL